MVPYGGSTDDFGGLGLQRDTQGVWYHNFVWSSLDSGALYEIYWYAVPHVYQSGAYDHRPVALAFSNFIQNIALNNGRYQDLAAEVSDPTLRAVGQKDVAAGNAYLWIQNRNHTWKKVVDGVVIASVTGTVRIGGFASSRTYRLEWWDPYKTAGQVVSTESLKADANGILTISVRSLATDAAAKIIGPPAPPANLRIK